MWLEAPFRNAAETLDPEDYGYTRDPMTGVIEPVLFDGPARPIDIPEPCKCKNCTKKTCLCKQNELSCSSYCKCSKTVCKNIT